MRTGWFQVSLASPERWAGLESKVMDSGSLQDAQFTMLSMEGMEETIQMI